ncbi:hypothetical protein QSH39_021355 [Xanthomonas arboricola pv. corylina]|uniref:hypothetical protein n=1 Tax=Xanthomonas TaxID=338 RepID=UPI00058568F6|nr:MULTISPECIES: hypothetical protein [Xanthomonas]MBB5734426.1 hypothetical protein [Xanthomonas sp. CFBP 8152]MDN0205393.1 hypothetical protein [Xanthomonas arboricola pv. corylina]MDN0218300.1 hypothetical protein [Xanthomonas arboricola pv. corylina]UQQ15391.1 hypothetical protein KPG65_02545 [Xanthomonas arboricola pv. corylina]
MMFCTFLVKLHLFITSFDWFEIIKSVAALVTASVAVMALKNWKKQDKAKREIEFLDSLIEAVHEFITAMAIPLGHFEFERIAMKAREPSSGDDNEYAGATAYISEHGDKAGEKLMQSLQNIEPSVTLLRSKIAKGQVFNFDGYQDCLTAVQRMTQQYDILSAAAMIMQSRNWNWNNPEVIKVINKTLLQKNAIDMREILKEGNIVTLNFATRTYTTTYK